MPETIVLLDGKYTFIRNDDGTGLHCLRYDQEWWTPQEGSNAISALFDYTKELENDLATREL